MKISIIIISILICNTFYGQTKGTFLNDSLTKVMLDSGWTSATLGNYGSTIEVKKVHRIYDSVPKPLIQTLIDSVQLWPILPNEILKETSGYKHFRDEEVDSCWLNKDTTFLMFRYYHKIIESFTSHNDTTIFYYNDRTADTLIVVPSTDTTIQYFYKKKKHYLQTNK